MYYCIRIVVYECQFYSYLYNYGILVTDGSSSLESMGVGVTGNTFYNSGEFFIDGGAIASGYTFSSTNFDNSGLLQFANNAVATLTLGSGTMTNTGTICLEDTEATLDAAVLGDGCIVLNDSGQLTVDPSTYSLGDQTYGLFFSGSYPRCSNTASTAVKVRGFGDSNKIEVNTCVLKPISSVSYDSTTGILTVTASSLLSSTNYYFDVGTGYTSSDFSYLINYVAYFDDPPNSTVPDSCTCGQCPFVLRLQV
ncbi:hypothetical protein KAFR_0G00620 [Kazachstania africana CBS 2517]|uniref:Hyphally-regulated cell wall protein N-terminal domain-containing protein n=1 Tax=Kazachstania africana (strain ATCC 22294 / BCRC 22015 / CBS 2517 / CECT 1963 / NBRC 1671 / NRRL Y-8276) TaxID=1071382 RepID=H2AXJ5_KAZAF|nr:hypothetical protein KAFR_0G00620 [Kazachstania africana CBS 2517]CCF59095.1 hypothetical protein KAFR_0G00620 [Kazachstania africana CBS 2517]